MKTATTKTNTQDFIVGADRRSHIRWHVGEDAVCYEILDVGIDGHRMMIPIASELDDDDYDAILFGISPEPISADPLRRAREKIYRMTRRLPLGYPPVRCGESISSPVYLLRVSARRALIESGRATWN